ncbi:MAG: hypothetical protein J6R36_03435 [Bacteroidaceae bacterium]|nr:hypothetical protein [Bacteroidaceae bacterium]
MGKGIGLIAGHTKKVGNTVGFRNSASNNGQTQGYRVYQPIVKNPQTAAQAEARAKTAAVNATYTMLKMIIDRGNEGLPYGNLSRCAWLKKAFKADIMPWFEKGAIVTAPVICQLTAGTIPSVDFRIETEILVFPLSDSSLQTEIQTTGDLTDVLLTYASGFREGDQLTLVFATPYDSGWRFHIKSFILDAYGTTPVEHWYCSDGELYYECDDVILCAASIISRQGAAGKHLRSTSYLKANSNEIINAPYDATSKSAAIASYQTSRSANTDWAEDNT